MDIVIPSTFQNFKQRQLQRGIETCSTTEYKGYSIFMRAYAMSGIYYKIYKTADLKKTKLRGRQVNFAEPEKFLQHAKDYIDNFLNK
jgi:hypothetical protein